jgi:hypothetical protein
VWTGDANGFTNGARNLLFSPPATWNSNAFQPTDGMAMGDVNGDGFADAVGFYGSYVSVMLSNATGTGFEGPATWPQPPLSSFTGNIGNLVGDIDGDGLADVIAVSTTGVSFMLSHGSSWGSVDTLDVSLPSGATLASGDVNGDGRVDVVLFTGNGTLVLTSNGATFNSPASWSSGTFAGSAVGDVNGDGLADAVAFEGSQVLVMLSEPGQNLFAPPNPWLTVDLTAQCGLSLADVNGDGFADIVAFGAYDTAGTMVALSNGTSFSLPQLWYEDTFSSPFLADVNGDGRADAVGFGQQQAIVMLAEPDGSWGTGTYAWFFLWDVTQGEAAEEVLNLSMPTAVSTAEWIVERTKEAGQFPELADYGSMEFTAPYAGDVNGGAHNPETDVPYLITMTNGSDVLSQCTSSVDTVTCQFVRSL